MQNIKNILIIQVEKGTIELNIVKVKKSTPNLEQLWMISQYIIQSYSIKVIQMKIRMKSMSENNDLGDRLPANKNFL